MQEILLFKVHKISINLYCSSHVGGQKNAHQFIFQHSIIENSPTSLTYNSVFVQITSNLVQRHIVWSYRPCQNLEQIDHNLHNHVFDDIICKPPIVFSSVILEGSGEKPNLGTYFQAKTEFQTTFWQGVAK